MTPAQGKIIAGFEDLADITDGALALVLTWPPRARVCAPVWRRLAGMGAIPPWPRAAPVSPRVAA